MITILGVLEGEITLGDREDLTIIWILKTPLRKQENVSGGLKSGVQEI